MDFVAQTRVRCAKFLFSVCFFCFYYFFCLFFNNRQLTDVERSRVVSVTGARVPRLKNEAGDAGVLDDVTPAGISDVVRRAQHCRRRIPIPVSVTMRPISDALPLPGATVGAGHATRSPRLHLGQAGLALSAAYCGAVCALCKNYKKKVTLKL